jgi:hypothetical protein
MDIYKRLIKEVLFTFNFNDEIINKLHELIFKVDQNCYKDSNEDVGDLKEFKKYLLIIHYINLRKNCLKKRELIYFASKLGISLLRYIKDFKFINHRIGRNETAILDFFEKTIGYRIIRQVCIEGFFIDGYIPELNLVVEIDEEHHQRRTDKDIIREAIIKNKLNCEFLRIKDYD